MLLNPGVMIFLAFAVLADEHKTHGVFIALGIIAYFVYWISVSYITIKIIDKVRKLGIFRKSKTAVP